MIKARHNWFYTWFLGNYSRILLWKDFKRVRIFGNIHSQDKPVLMIGNHFSWWDGFIAYHINRKILKKRFHVMMLEEQLRSRMFLSRAGAYSVRKGSRTVVESIKYTRELLQNKNNLVVIYPQGEIASIHQKPVRFEKGFSRFTSGAGQDFKVVFYAALMDYYSDRKPSLNIYLKEVEEDVEEIAGWFEDKYNEFLSECVSSQKPE